MRFLLHAILVLIASLLFSCASDPTTPDNGGNNNTEQWLYIPVYAENLTNCDVARWKPGMTQPEIVVADAEITNPPQNGKLAVIRYDGDSSSVVVCDLNGSNADTVLRFDGRIRSAGLSHDAKYVAYTYHDPVRHSRVYQGAIIPVSGGTPFVVADFTAWENPMYWSPTQNTLAFIATDENDIHQDTLVLINADGSNRRVLSTNVKSVNDGWVMWRWNSVGTELLYLEIETPVFHSINVSTGTDVIVYQSMNPGVLYACTNELSTAYFLTLIDVSANKEPIAQHIARYENDSVSVLHSITGTSVFQYGFDVSDADAYLAYMEVDMNGPTDPSLSRCAIKVLKLSDNSVIDLHVNGGIPFWSH